MEDSALVKNWFALATLIAAVASVNNGWAFASLLAVLAWTLYVRRSGRR
jgi:hypothetical protein